MIEPEVDKEVQVFTSRMIWKSYRVGSWIDVWPILKPGFDLFTKLRKIEFNFSFDTVTDDVIVTCIPMI